MLKLLPKQEHAVYYLKDDKTTEVLYGGAAGGGKTALGCLWLIDRCQNLPGTRWLMAREKLEAIKSTTLKTFFELATKLGISDQFNYNENKKTIFWNNGSEIILKELFYYPSDPEMDALGSWEITGAFVDEASQIVNKAWQVVKSRCRFRLLDFDVDGELTKNMRVTKRNENGDPIQWRKSNGKLTNGLIPKILGTCNPTKNWVYSEFYKAKRDGKIKYYRKFIAALPSDNPYLPASYLEALLQMNKAARERLYYGNWEYDDDPNALCEYEDILAIFHNGHAYDENAQNYITCDPARKGKDKAVVLLWKGWTVTKYKEYATSSLTLIQNLINEWRNDNGVPNKNAVADEDGVGGGVVDNCNIKGFVNNSTPIDTRTKTEKNNGVPAPNFNHLQSQCGFILAEKIRKNILNIQCELPKDTEDEIVEELEQLKQHDADKDGKLKITPKKIVVQNIGRSPNWRDALLMRAYFDLNKKYTGTYFFA